MSAYGYRCKQCGGAAPTGQGYTSTNPEHARKSPGTISCPCGYTQRRTPPPGLTSTDPVPEAPYRRWNGKTWPTVWVREYNWALKRIEERHRDGHDVTALVDGLYNLAHSFDTTPDAPERMNR